MHTQKRFDKGRLNQWETFDHSFFQIMWLADRHSDQELYTAAKHCAKIHLVQLHQTDEFLNMPLCLLIDIIKGE